MTGAVSSQSAAARSRWPIPMALRSRATPCVRCSLITRRPRATSRSAASCRSIPRHRFRSGRRLELSTLDQLDAAQRRPDRDSHHRWAGKIAGPIGHFQKPGLQASAHYIVGRDGQVVQMVRHRDIAWHATSANSTSIGIEHCARSPRELGRDDPGLPVTPAQYQASARLVRFLCQQHGNSARSRSHQRALRSRKDHARGLPEPHLGLGLYMSLLTAAGPPTLGLSWRPLHLW